MTYDDDVIALGRSLRRVGAIMHLGEATGFDPQATLINAWMYQLAVGWDCEGRCERPNDPVHTCTGALDELAERNGWPDWFVAQLRAARTGLVKLVVAGDREQATVDALHQAGGVRAVADYWRDEPSG